MRWQLTPARYRRITVVALAALVFIVVTGAAVRLTGSGLGCPDWPTCDGSQLVAEFREPNETIEFVNRLITGVVSVAVALAVIGARRRRPYRRDLERLSWGLVAGVAANAVVGGISVKVELAPVTVGGHFLLSMVLLAVALVLHRRAGEPEDGRFVAREDRLTVRLSWAMVALASLVLLAGTLVTGTGPHGGDPDVERLDLAIREVVRVHATLAWLLTAVLVAVMVRTRRGWPVIGAVAVQIAVGYVQYFNGVPELLVGIHVFVATLVWLAVLDLHLSSFALVAREPEAPVAAPGPEPVGAAP